MKQILTTLAAAAFTLGTMSASQAQNCHNIDVHGDQPFGPASNQRPGACNTTLKNGFLIPDAGCTPGAFNPTVTLEILQDPNYHTRCNRDLATTAEQKFVTYSWYRLRHPANNQGANQLCELDHVVPLELGGADTLDNVWPQCGPNGAGLNKRYFKLKDTVENYLTAMVKAGKMNLDDARKGAASDWTQYLQVAVRVCRGDRCKV
jgi:hypothetical protein